MASADALFAQADTNRDQRLDLNEFRNLAGSSGALYGGAGASGASYGAGDSSASYGAVGGGLNSLGATGSYNSSSSFESSSTTGGAYGGDLAYAGAGIGGAGLGGAGYGSSSYESSYSSLGGNAGGDLASVGGAYSAEGASGLSSTDLTSSSYSSSQTTATQQYQTDAQGLFRDTNPQIIRRPAPGGALTYTQNIKVRFLQPPAIPPPGPLIIKEVRPPQPPPPPPLRIRQQAPPLPQPPPLVLREKPPQIPASVASQTVIRRLAAIPVPPRSVIIERLAALPAKPRDIIIERWIPYGAAAKRRTIVQRAAGAQAYQTPRNVIIQYEAPQVRIVRQFQRLGVSQESPQAYLQRYGAILLDSQSLVQQARAAGVVEDISPPAVAGGLSVSSSQFSSSAGTLGYDAAGLDAGAAGLGSASSYESSSYSAGGDVSGFGAGVAVAGADLGGASSYESSSYSASGDASGFGAGLSGAGLGGASSYESSSYSSSAGTALGGGADAAFASADTNRDGVLSQSEFRSAGY